LRTGSERAFFRQICANFSEEEQKGMRVGKSIATLILAVLFAVLPAVSAAPRKAHSVVLGATRHMPYTKAGDPAGAAQGENELKVRALLVDGVLKEWTTGDAHDVTDRSFVVRRVIRLNDALPENKTGPGDKPIEKPIEKPSDRPGVKSAPVTNPWVWQRGPWLLVDRVTGRVLPLKLPDYDPGVSQVVWFRDYGAYCGVTASGKSLYAMVAQVAARKAVLAKKLEAFDAENHPQPVCGPAEWQREPLRITFHPVGKEPVSFDIVPGSAVLVEEAGDEPETPIQGAGNKK
jgi:hypothetical protein